MEDRLPRFAFPVTLDVAGRRCVVVGGGPIAAEKAEALGASGADVVVVPAGEFREELLDGAFLVVATGEDGTDADTLFAAAETRGVLANSMDDVDNCHFAFPAVVRRGDLKVAISTAGKAPVLSGALRRRFGAELPDAYGVLVDALGEAREVALPRTIPFGDWAQRWRDAVADLDALLELAASGRTDAIRDHVLGHVLGRVTEEAS